ncbi:hypothetical protein [Streptomyces sp. NPDC059970]|uniref:hypothetical protein n=1 Tax=Streptomyces sp. NPDC059970 TaxID=3347019 RepID=UPI0036A5FAFB
MDAHGKRWYPQGITTSHDAYGGSVPGSGGKTVALVSWYDKQTAGNQGAKVSVIDVTRTGASSRPRYDHVLLVEPTKESGEPFDFRVTTLHAGGIAWVGKWLCVADRNRGLYVFDTTRMLKVSRGSTGETRERAKSWCGYHAGDKKYYAHGYRYVMPLHHVYRPAGWSANLAYSQVSLDRTQGAAQSLVVSEYFEKSRDGVAVRWNLNSAGYITAERAASTWPLRIARVQGAVCVGDRTYYSANAPVKPAAPKGPKQGSLWLQRPWGAKMTAPRGKLTLGPEDLSYQPRAGGGSLVPRRTRRHQARLPHPPLTATTPAMATSARPRRWRPAPRSPGTWTCVPVRRDVRRRHRHRRPTGQPGQATHHHRSTPHSPTNQPPAASTTLQVNTLWAAIRHRPRPRSAQHVRPRPEAPVSRRLPAG